jgi:hypothetical protein
MFCGKWRVLQFDHGPSGLGYQRLLIWPRHQPAEVSSRGLHIAQVVRQIFNAL